jgi:hypothetical protein
VESGELVILLLRGGLRSPKSFSLQTLILGLQRTDDDASGHIVVNLDGLQFECKHVAL